MTTETALRPCPFCGANAELVKGDPVKLSWLSIRCTSCGVETPQKAAVDRAEKIWNRRTEDVRE